MPARPVRYDGQSALEGLDRHEYVTLPAVFGGRDVRRISDELSLRVGASPLVGVQRRRGDVYAARNLLDKWPEVVKILRTPALSGAIKKVLGAHDGAVYAVQFSADGRFLASGSADSTAIVWTRIVSVAIDPPVRRRSPTCRSRWRPADGTLVAGPGGPSGGRYAREAELGRDEPPLPGRMGRAV